MSGIRKFSAAERISDPVAWLEAQRLAEAASERAAARIVANARRAGVDEATCSELAAMDAEAGRAMLAAVLARPVEARRMPYLVVAGDVDASRAASAARRRGEALSIRRAKAGRKAELRARKAVDEFARMVDAGRVPDDLAAAGYDLARVVEGAQAGMMAATDPDSWKAGGIEVTGRKGAPQFSAIVGYADRYLPWAREMLDPACRIGPKGRGGEARFTGRQGLDVTLAVVVRATPCRTLDQAHGWRRGSAGGLLMDGLRAYARRMPRARD